MIPMCRNRCHASLAHQKCDITDLYENSTVLGVTVKKFFLRLLVKLCLTKKDPPEFVPELTEGVNPGVIQTNSKIIIYLDEARISQKEF